MAAVSRILEGVKTPKDGMAFAPFRRFRPRGRAKPKRHNCKTPLPMCPAGGVRRTAYCDLARMAVSSSSVSTMGLPLVLLATLVFATTSGKSPSVMPKEASPGT